MHCTGLRIALVEAHAAASKMQASPSRDHADTPIPKYSTIQKCLQHMGTMVTMGHHSDAGDVTGGIYSDTVFHRGFSSNVH